MEYSPFVLDIVDGGRSPELEATPETDESSDLCLKSVFKMLKSPDTPTRIRGIEALDSVIYSPTGRPEDAVYVCQNPVCEVQVPAYDGTRESLREGTSLDNPALIDCVES